MIAQTYAYGTKDLVDCLNQFEIGESVLVDVKLFQMLSPDAFLWKLRLTNGLYYLYAEDYVESVDAIEKYFTDLIQGRRGHFVQAREKSGNQQVSGDSTISVNEDGDTVFLYKIDELSELDKQEL